MSLSSPSRNPSPSAFVTLSGVTVRTPDGHPLFETLSLVFGRERTGIVGRNGAGKSTLLRLVAGEISPAEGVVTRVGSVGLLHQRHDPTPGETVKRTLGVEPELAVIDRVLAGQATDEDLETADWTLESRIGERLGAVGLEGLDLDRPTAGLSGGELTRLRLAGLMLAGPDLLLLDEPTNHLDQAARRFVQDALEAWPGGSVVVSHDRNLLNRMDRIVELSDLGVSTHGGGYDQWAERRVIERAAAGRALAEAERGLARADRDAQAARERQARRDRAGRAFRMRASEPTILLDAAQNRAERSAARGSALAEKSRAVAEAAMETAEARAERRKSLGMILPPSGLAAGRTVLAMQGVVWRAPDGRRIVGPVDVSLTGPERVAVVGPNGAGKSTLLRLAAGDLEPAEGSVTRPGRSALLDQDVSLLRRDETLVEAFQRLNPQAGPNAARAALARGLFRNTSADRTVGSLSGGERLRAGLVCVMGAEVPPELLILDEPTNHLDLDAVEAVEAVLAAWDGALLVVSHDDDFLEAIGIERRIKLGGDI